MYEEDNLNKWEINSEIKDALKNAYDSRKLNRINNEDGIRYDNYITNNVSLDELYSCINNNVWLNYFIQCSSFAGENWIDFEVEISKVIQALDAAWKIIDEEKDIAKLSTTHIKIIIKILKQVIIDDGKNWDVNEVLGNIDRFNIIIDVLESDLNRLIRALEIYLCGFVEKIHIGKNHLI